MLTQNEITQSLKINRNAAISGSLCLNKSGSLIPFQGVKYFSTPNESWVVQTNVDAPLILVEEGDFIEISGSL
jgi:hypothetical protein